MNNSIARQSVAGLAPNKRVSSKALLRIYRMNVSPRTARRAQNNNSHLKNKLGEPLSLSCEQRYALLPLLRAQGKY